MADFAAVDIANRALQKVGAKRIASLTEDSVNGRAVNAMYDSIRQTLLQSFPWKFAVTRQSIAEDATAPEFGRERSFTLPSTCLRLLPPYPEDDFDTREWLIEGRKIFTDYDSPLKVRFIQDITNPNEMTPLFREAFASALAAELCEPLTQSNAKYERLAAEAQRLRIKAQTSDAQEGPPTEQVDDAWINARY